MRSTMFCLSPSWWACKTRAHSIGVSVSETKPETTIATAIDTANSRNTRPTMPPISSTGMNTAISEKVIEMMVKPISRAPLSAASNGRIPPSTWRTMFSSMTMASSTTKPTESVSASSVMLLIENPNTYIAAQVPISDTGTASAGMRVAETERRNRKITRTTRQIAMSSVSCTSTTEARIETERSISTSMRIDGGIEARYCGKRARTESTTATVFASGWRWIASTMARSLLNQLAILSFSTLSMTRAT